jgi:dephospho-CoA kinase
VVVNDVPLLVEVGLAATYHLVVVVEADEAVRVRRLVETRGMSPEQARARIAAQADDTARRAAADVLLRNDAGLAHLDAAVEELWLRRLVPYESNVRHGRCVHARPGPARLVPSDPTWAAQAARITARIRYALRSVLPAEAAVTHIGSTAVPGLPAKDVIDLMLAVDSLERADGAADALTRAGLPHRAGEWFDRARGVPDGRWPKRMHGSADPARPVHLHIRVSGSPGWRFALLMRDHLRADPAVRDAYADVKRRLAAAEPDVPGYARAKEPWFDAEAVAAERWAERTGWRPAEH